MVGRGEPGKIACDIGVLEVRGMGARRRVAGARWGGVGGARSGMRQGVGRDVRDVSLQRTEGMRSAEGMEGTAR